MNLDFKILWLEDNNSAFSEKSELVSRVIKRNGFHPDIERVPVNQALSYSGYDSADLIISDFKLGGGTYGTEYLRNLQNNSKIFPPILFYSSSPDELLLSLKNNLISGVYVTGRASQEFNSNFENLLGSLTRKHYTYNGLRGIFLDEVCHHDFLIIELLRKKLDSHENKEKMIKTANKIFKDKHKMCTIDHEITSLTIDDIQNDYSLYDSFNRLRLVSNELKMITGVKKFVEEYKRDIIDYRNSLAHSSPKFQSVESNLCITVRKQPVNFDKNFCISRYESLTKYRSYFKIIEKYLSL